MLRATSQRSKVKVPLKICSGKSYTFLLCTILRDAEPLSPGKSEMLPKSWYVARPSNAP